MGNDLEVFFDELEEFLEDQEDVRDGEDGQSLPNAAMSLLMELRRLRPSIAPSAGGDCIAVPRVELEWLARQELTFSEGRDAYIGGEAVAMAQRALKLSPAPSNEPTREAELSRALNKAANLILYLYGYTHPGGEEAFLKGTGAAPGSLVERGQILYREMKALLAAPVTPHIAASTIEGVTMAQKTKFPQTIIVTQEKPANDDAYLAVADLGIQGFPETTEVAIYELKKITKVTVTKRLEE